MSNKKTEIRSAADVECAKMEFCALSYNLPLSEVYKYLNNDFMYSVSKSKDFYVLKVKMYESTDRTYKGKTREFICPLDVYLNL